MLPIKSLGYQTDFFFHQFEAEVTEKATYYCVRTHTNPGYHYGNFLVFKEAPRAKDYTDWRSYFYDEIGRHYSQKQHELYGWDNPETGDIRKFTEAGFQLEHSSVMTLQTLSQALVIPAGITLRPLESPADFEQAINLQTQITLESGYSDPRTYHEAKMASYRRMIAAGLGKWFGAFSGDTLAAHMGLFWQGGVGRYQEVATHANFRRRGIARALTHYVAEYGLAQIDLETLVVVADVNYHAKDLYESVGFRHTEDQYALYWHVNMKTALH
jgi:ribosomal protein S18 acetylase RimI-like enzyme